MSKDRHKREADLKRWKQEFRSAIDAYLSAWVRTCPEIPGTSVHNLMDHYVSDMMDDVLPSITVNCENDGRHENG